MEHRMVRSAATACVALLALGLAGGMPGNAAPGGPAATIRLRVMTFNIFYGGDELNLATGNWCHRPDGCPETLEKVIEVIRASGADIVGLEEGEHSTRTIAEALGWHWSERTQYVSRFPLIDPPGGEGLYIFAAPSPGRIVALANVHLPSDPYGPYLVRDGAPPGEIVALETSVRLPALRDHLRVLPGLAAAGIPVFLVGDFNSPSHLDWTAAVAAVRKEVPYPFDWPVSRALADAGFRDSYRTVHADPVAVPGFTWTPGGPEEDANEVHDRIDWVLSVGPAAAIASTIVGEPGGPDVGVAIDPYPTDHRGVVSTFEVAPASAPVLVAVGSRRVETGDVLPVTFHAPGKAGERIAIVPAGAPAGAAVSERPTGEGRPTDGSVSFPTLGLEPRAYEAILLDAKAAVLSRSPFWLYPAGAPATVATDRAIYLQGEPIRVSWTGAPGMRWDWLGIYAPGESGEGPVARSRTSGGGANSRYLLYEYTRTAIEGTAVFTAESAIGWKDWPLSPGNYQVRLLLDDGYRTLATSAPFKIERK